MKRKDILKQIESFDNRWFNEEQKEIALSIIKNTPDNLLKEVFDFIKFKRRTGFAFDSSPEIAKGRIITPNLIKNIGVEKNSNLLLIGDNYNALKLLSLTHKGIVDVIYIDPPYNTDSMKEDGNQSSKEMSGSSKFIYKDKFGRTGWLNMMNERLKMANELLSNDGVIFVSIDDSEQAYLKVLMDEIFGEENFVGNLPRRATSGGKADSKFIRSQTDYLLIYKKPELNEFDGITSNPENYKLNDDVYGKYYLREVVAPKGIRYSTSLDYDIEINDVNYSPFVGTGERYCWRWGRERFEKAIRLGIVEIKNNKPYQKVFYEYDFDKQNELSKMDRKIKIENLEYLDSKYSNTNAISVIKSIFGDRVFDYPKPTTLIKDLLKLVGYKKNAIVLDFFAGSGTTGHAVMELNREDGGSRSFILSTNNENNIGIDITAERLNRIITGESTNKEDFAWIKNNKPFQNEGVKVIELDDSTEIKLNISDEKIKEVTDAVLKGVKLLDEKYNPSKLDLYYDLSALNPLEEE